MAAASCLQFCLLKGFMSAHYKSLARRTKPNRVAVFPLNGAMLLPACDLPLNIFEPRYLNMIDDALKGERLIGMVQSQGDTLAKIGGLGRITQFSESEDGRYLIVLKGLKRFKITGEPEVKTPYRQAEVSFEDFEDDADIHGAKQTSQLSLQVFFQPIYHLHKVLTNPLLSHPYRFLHNALLVFRSKRTAALLPSASSAGASAK